MQKVKMMKKFADLIAEAVVKASPKQDISITADVEMYTFVRYLISELYKYKVRRVDVDYYDRQTMRQFLMNTPESRLNSDERELMKLKDEDDRKAAKLLLLGEDYQYIERLPMDRYNSFIRLNQTEEANLFARYCRHELVYSVIPVPTLTWAKDLFPDLTPMQALNSLWTLLYKACGINEVDNSHLSYYEKHIDHLEKIEDILNDSHILKLHITSEEKKTDFSVELPMIHVWQMGSFIDKSTGNRFLRTLPCNEVYVALSSHGADGIVYASRNFYFQGELVKDAWIRIKNGKIIEHGASSGKKVLDNAFVTDNFATRLGKIGIVERHPYSTHQVNFKNKYWNENEETHLIIGDGAADCIKKDNRIGQEMTINERVGHGLNQSQLSLFFPIYADDLKIVGTKLDRSEIVIFKDGKWAI